MRPFSPWLKGTYTLLVVLLAPPYALEHGPANFLWFSNVALFGTLIGIWLHSRLLISMMAVAVLLPEIGWNLLFWGRLFFGWDPFELGLLAYMFDPQIPLWIRLASLYHVPLPFFLLWLVWTRGYDRRALQGQIVLGWTVLVVSYLITTPLRNVNLVYGPLDAAGAPLLPPPAMLILLMAGLPLLVYWPTHAFLEWVGGRETRPKP